MKKSMSIIEEKKFKIDKNNFKNEVIKGLSEKHKKLQSKYFYNAMGDELFQKIMHCNEYYLTDCELEILQFQSKDIITSCLQEIKEFDIVELGAGDASKSIYLLEEIAKREKRFHYFPIDISSNIIAFLEKDIPSKIPSIIVNGLRGEYFNKLEWLKNHSSKPKLVLFLGSSIGNMTLDKVAQFLQQLQNLLNPGDLLLTGFDLVKDPKIILKAYNDTKGYTKLFNLNLLHRINQELNGNFNLNQFEHKPVYNTEINACESYLVSLKNQSITIANQHFYFNQGERIFMETSQKFELFQINQLAIDTGFFSLRNFFDDKKWFTDALWKVT